MLFLHHKVYLLLSHEFQIHTTKRKDRGGRWGSTKATGGVYFWLTHMLFRGVQPVRPKGDDADKPEVTWWMSSGAVSIPEIPSTHTLSWTAEVHKDKSVVMLLVLPSPWQNELCRLCQEDRQHHSAPDGYQWSQWMWNVQANSLWRSRELQTYDSLGILCFTEEDENGRVSFEYFAALHFHGHVRPQQDKLSSMQPSKCSTSIVMDPESTQRWSCSWAQWVIINRK